MISDIHGNAAALEVVLAELDRANVDQLVCLGDVANLGPQPQAVIRTLRERGIPTVIGNADVWLVPDHHVPAVPTTSGESAAVTNWVRGQLSDDDLDWLRELPLILTLPLANGAQLTCFHASPTSVDEVVASSTPASSVPGAEQMRAGDLMAYGHTHLQMVRRIGQGHLINPGSVGLPGTGPGESGLPVNLDVAWAEYAIVEIESGKHDISLKRIPIDGSSLRLAVLDSGMPHPEWWLGFWANPNQEPRASG